MGEKIRLAKAKTARKEDHSSSGLNKPGSTGSQRSPVDDMLHLQTTIGNSAVTELIQSGVIQAKLQIGQPDDIYEQEADRVAEQVMRMTGTCPECEEEQAITPLVQRQIVEEEEEIIQTKPVSHSNSQVNGEIESRIQSMKGSGQPLSETARAFFEPRFGVDFSQVRVHTDSTAARTARAINARAFTTGSDIVFGHQQYSPGTSSGRNLLAHELTHVVQQGKTVNRKHNVLSNTIHRMAEVSIYRAKDQCQHPYFTGYYGLDNVDGKSWYPHDYTGPIDVSVPYEVAKTSSTGYKVPRSESSKFNCMGWALCHGEDTASWQQGVTRTDDHPWPEEELLESKGCSSIDAGKSAKHKVKLYEYKDQDQFHIVRQEHDGLWSAKTGRSFLWRGITDSNAHTTSYYSQDLSNLRITYWSCP